MYALIAGTAAHERHTGEDLIAHYLRISSTPVPDMRPEGIPAGVCAAIEKAMSLDPANRQKSAEEFGHELQLAQRRNGLIPDSMALSETNSEPAPEPPQTVGTAAMQFTGTIGEIYESKATSDSPGGPSGPTPPTPPPGHSRAPWPIPQPSDMPTSITRPKRNFRPLLFAAAAAVVAVLLVVGGVFIVSTFTKRDTGEGVARPSQPTAEKQADWQPITNARVAREAVATFDPELQELGRKVVDAMRNMGARGPLNVQAKETAPHRFEIFELNFRCTGLTGVRAAMGFNEIGALLGSWPDDDAAQQAAMRRCRLKRT